MSSEDELNKEVLRQILFDAVSEQVDNELKRKENIIENNDKEDKQIPSKKNKKNKRRTKVKGKSKKKSIKDFLKDQGMVKTLLFFALALIVNTYAWFLYVSTVSTSLDIHITSWLFEFSESEDTIILSVDRIFPGMETFTKDVTGSNLGEMSADLTVALESVRILDEVYNVGDTYTIEGGGTGTYTSQDLITMLQEKYPFKVNIYVDDELYDGTEIVLTTGDNKTVTYEVVWPYESTDDADRLESFDIIDTQMGNKAYEYFEAHKNDTDENTKDCIFIKLVMKAVQDEGDPNNTPDPNPGP
ncbi:MAG: G5 domain-containing protein [Clostridia bacterium]|nr:G5 domain-containing protein [Clostridia bacterium]